MPRATFADPPVTSTSTSGNGQPTETSRLKDHVYTPTYSYVDDDLEALGSDLGDDGREVEVWKPGHSGFYQTLLNVLGDLIGTGLLATPIAIAHAGWVFGPLILAFVGGVTLWTLKILLRIIAQDRRLRNFTDVIGFALGKRAEKFITVLFIAEVAAWVITLVVLFSDSLEAVLPMYSSNQWKVIGLIVVIPTMFLPLHYLAYSSFLGILSTWALVVILIFTGIVTPEGPGSIRDPAPTDLWPPHGWMKFATVFGLMIGGFGGHGLIPNLIYDMQNPHEAERVCEVAYGIAMAVYVSVGFFGYLMYGRDVSDEVSRDLAQTRGFSPLLAKLAVWMVALNPLTKIALGVRPLADVLFSYFGLHKTELVPEEAPTPRYVTRPSSPTSSQGSVISDSDPVFNRHGADPAASHFSVVAEARHQRSEKWKDIVRPAIRVVLGVLSVLLALVFPSFEALMALLGSGFASVTLVIVPVWAGASLFGWHWYDYTAIVVAAVAGVVGCFAAFWP
ncbi:uncharacterized protein CcaverHIS019_0401830 [Cutaneotrichosporon cavernicola]|uniref:Amino acid transporter transmembrane domain-containing protein n=1 Tax=Cutaneotrichosporon cavernicola TaxID=279322 RepID=A0AA48L3P9_9TREE|nr:uncharacterized protein CcaverHIS019_0401830 [Cutaneotrichosporon cavernicola]BEI91363.1 hypothetical protein CcaverHIS019_0401830 [Cutaneotrichosporon cavernicola]BEI99136.1 hypothetical protein CcaverHIS631_0401790 [Cutaneotrichosporon cavernicola]BEJ06911.1 hypothetical protein CcaverHIS641_0401800 [Cutaneotrichosporon cavernicola]